MSDRYFFVSLIYFVLQVSQLFVELLLGLLVLFLLFLDTLLKSLHLLQTRLVNQLVKLVLFSQLLKFLGLFRRNGVNLSMLLDEIVFWTTRRRPSWGLCAMNIKQLVTPRFPP